MSVPCCCTVVSTDQEVEVKLEKTPFQVDTLTELFRGSRVRPVLRNDIYSTYLLQAPPHLNEIKATVGPATKIYQCWKRHLVEETYQDYRCITLPYLEAKGFSLQWVYSILEKKAETDRIVYEDPDPLLGFMVLPDIKWDQKQVDDLHLIAIVNQRSIKSLRDLTAEHLPLLQNIFQKGTTAIQQRYNLPACKVRIYLSYQPSFYHLHVHFTNLKYREPGCSVDRAQLLTNVIEDLHYNPHYYQNMSIFFSLREDDELLSKFQEAGRLEGFSQKK